MFTLGTIFIKDESSIVDARSKIRNLAVDLGFSAIESTRISTATSEICWLLLANQQQASIDVSLQLRQNQYAISLIFKSDAPVKFLKVMHL